MLAPVLLHLYSEEVRSKFRCLILQLIANGMSIALQHSPFQAAGTSNATMQTQTSQSLNGMFTGKNIIDD